MQDQFPEGSHGLDMSPQSLMVTHNLGSQSSHRPASDSNLEISPKRPGTRHPSHPQISDHRPTPDNLGALGSPLMSAGSLSSDNPQMRNHQQIPNYSPRSECRQRNNYTPAYSYYPVHNNPPAQGYLPAQGRLYEHHQPIHPGAYSSASPYLRVGMADNGLDLNPPQPNAELNNPPIIQYPSPSYRGIDTCHISSAQTQTNRPVGPDISLAGNTAHGELDKDMHSPNTRLPTTPLIPHAIPPQYRSARLPLLPTAVPVMHNPEREIIIAVMGVTGAGKSHFIREVSSIADIEVSSGLHSCTTKVQCYSFPYAGAEITLVDTPGFNDTTESDTKVLTDICAWMSSSYREGKLLSGIIYLHRITDVRMDGTSLKNFKMLQKICGPDALKNVLLTTTQWSNVAQAQGEKREGELRDGEFWGELMKEGAAVARFMGTKESGLDLISKLIENEPKPLHIQDEMEVRNMALVETNVGKFMNNELISLQKKYEKDLEDLERARQNAIKEKDDEMEKILAQEQSDARKKLEKAEAEIKSLADLHEAQMGELKEALRKGNEGGGKEDSAVIAVALKDISIVERVLTMVTPCSAKGRLIYNIDDRREFQQAPLDITIRYQSNASLISHLSATVIINNYVVYNKKCYWPKPGGPITIDTQKFYIFKRNSHK